jgi:hypothetical protein
MRINVQLGVDHEDLLLFEAFLQAVEKRRDARYAAAESEIEGMGAIVHVAKETPMSSRVIAMAPELGMPYPRLEVSRDIAPTVADVLATPIGAKIETSVFTEEDVASATMALAQAKGMAAATAVLTKFGAERARDIKVEQRADYIAALKA